MKKMLFVNGNYNDIPLIRAAQRLGFYVITSGNDASGEGHRYANEYCPCDYSDKEAILDLAIRKKVDAICSCGNDFGAISAAYACEKLGLPGHDTYANTRLFHEKDEFKKLAMELSLPTPTAKAFIDEKEAINYISCASFPKMVKPVDLGAGRGISVVYRSEEGEQAVRFAFQKSKVKHIVIEDYIEGEQCGVVTFIKDRKVVMMTISNDYSYLNPYMVWLVSTPHQKADQFRKQLTDDIEKIAEAKQIADGFFCIQFMVKDNKLYYLETMRRCLGNYHYEAMSKDCGVDLYELYVAQEAGLDCTEYVKKLQNVNWQHGTMGIYGWKNGKVRTIEFDEEFQKTFFDSIMLNGPGYEVTDYLHDKLGNVLFQWTPEQREYFLSRKDQLFKVTYEE